MDFLAVAVTVPLVTAFIGWMTNWAAVKMIFHPQRFVGVWKIGWQGVLPARADRFARDVADTVTENILSARELAERLDPDEMERLFADDLDTELPVLVAEAAEIVRPGLWDRMAPEARTVVIEQVRTEGRRIAHEVFDRLQGISDELLDLRTLVVDLLTGENVDRLVRLFQRMGRRELRFIEIYGGVFGFAVGLVQVALYGVFNRWWLMPIVGLAVGLGTNWLAIQMIFRPLEPRRYLGIVEYQGMFPKRQAEIAAEYGEVAATEIFTPRNLLRLVTEGEAGTRIARMVLEVVSERIDAQRPTLEMLAGGPVTDEQLGAVKALVVRHVTEAVPEFQPRLERYLEAQLGVAELVRSKLAGLPKPEFERILRGVLEEDEIILVIIGGVLGLAVGLLQGVIVLALT